MEFESFVIKSEILRLNEINNYIPAKFSVQLVSETFQLIQTHR